MAVQCSSFYDSFPNPSINIVYLDSRSGVEEGGGGTRNAGKRTSRRMHKRERENAKGTKRSGSLSFALYPHFSNKRSLYTCYGTKSLNNARTPSPYTPHMLIRYTTP